MSFAYWQLEKPHILHIKNTIRSLFSSLMRFLKNVPNLISSVRFSGFPKTCKSFKVPKRQWHNYHSLIFFELLLCLPYLVLLSASHHVEEEIYAALVDDGHAVQESYFICKRGGAKNEDRKVPPKSS